MIEYLLIADFCQTKIIELNFPKIQTSPPDKSSNLITISQKHNKKENSRYTQTLKKNKTLFTYLDKFGNHIITISNKKVYSEEKIFEILIKIGEKISELDFENKKEIEKKIPEIDKIISNFNKKIIFERKSLKTHSVTDHTSLEKTDFLSKTPDYLRSLSDSREGNQGFKEILEEKERQMKIYLFLFSGSLLVIFIGTLFVYRNFD